MALHCWMTLICLLGCIANRGTTVARAWSLSNQVQRTAGKLSSILSQSDSSDEDDDKAPVRIGKTGWNHNLPSEESSFWKSQLGAPTASPPSPDQASDEPKTGWLHNTEPRVKQQEETKSSDLSQAQSRLHLAMTQKERNHCMISPPAFHASSDSQIVVTEHKISVPVYRGDPSSDERMDAYFSIVELLKDSDLEWWSSLQQLNPLERARAYVDKAALQDGSQLLLFLQGGPGFGAPTPIVGLGFSSPESSWAAKALLGKYYERLVFMDQRGTGRSTPVTKQSLAKKFPDLFLLDDKEKEGLPSLDDFEGSYPKEYLLVKKAVDEATNFMAQFRADNIVQDAEEIKDALLLPGEGPRPYGCALGQSFGGFCMMTYLSLVDNPPKICLLTGGIAPMLTPVYDLYDKLWERVKERNLRYYEMYPGDIKVVKNLVKTLLDKPVVLPSGSNLTARRFLHTGIALGGSPASFARLHALLNSAFLDPHNEEPEFTRAFLKAMDTEHSFDDHPIYFLMHESIYCDAAFNSPSNWAAHRAYESRVKTPSEFDYRLTSVLESDARPTLFFGEMVFPWMADGDFAEIGGVGMKSLAHSIAQKDDWGPLYDAAHMRRVLKDGSISRAAASIYYEDMYVDFDLAMAVAKRGGPLEKCKVWVSNDYQHSGLRDDGAVIFAKLHGMATGSIRTPS